MLILYNPSKKSEPHSLRVPSEKNDGFYELGLAHADKKPVVFISANIDDVPFDLRHIRFIIYDTNDPFWGDKLKVNLTAYLKTAKADPKKSIPQPFRDQENK